MPPRLEIPLAMISYDLFWHFAPLTYPESLVQEYDRSLLDWLEQADVVFSISESNRQDILSLFPDFAAKIESVPLSGFLGRQHLLVAADPSDVPFFYFPSAYSLYKDHLTLIQASVQLWQAGFNFKVVLTGRNTDQLSRGEFDLPEQSKLPEHQDYVERLEALYQAHPDFFAEHFEGLGYCDGEVVEKLYATCAGVVFPSRFEGFGFALSEAIVRGQPVIASDLPVLREQVELYRCGDRVQLFAPGDVGALAACMKRVLLEPPGKLSPEQIQERFGHWRWEDVAAQYVRILAQFPA
ncbi:MAG: glycosyltransferase family 4 protein [Chloroflexaceae bacterium]|nr:glycosyltransferase family 4 protein [Chloroflexaceae bacterium]